jgi:hypothetical protein
MERRNGLAAHVILANPTRFDGLPVTWPGSGCRVTVARTIVWRCTVERQTMRRLTLLSRKIPVGFFLGPKLPRFRLHAEKRPVFRPSA